MASVRWGIVGPGSIAQNFADGMAQATSGRLVAVTGRDAARRDAFADRNAITTRHADAAALFADPGVDAVYISTPHPAHAQLSIAALRAGKHVLCEKPGGMNAAEVTAVAAVATQENRLWAEAFMYRLHPQITRIVEIVEGGEIGKIAHIRSHFGFAAEHDPKSRLYDPALGGGGILDVGGYPVSLVRLIAGVAEGRPFADPVTLRGNGLLSPEGVDTVAYALMTFASGITAEVGCAIARRMDNAAVITGTLGEIRIDDPWIPGRNAGPSTTAIHVTTAAGSRLETLGDDRMLFAYEAEAISAAIAAGKTAAPFPALSPADSIGNNTVLDLWRRDLGYATFRETAVPPRLIGTMPQGPEMPMARIPGLDRDLSQYILGCDNRDTLAEGAITFDAWIEAGGNTFDTAFHYAGGLHEQVLGAWMRDRGIADQVTVTVKGAHSPYCLPDVIAVQLAQSLDRLGIGKAQIYVMHRDNPAVPVGEFVEAVNREIEAGRIGIWGGSNWTPGRFDKAVGYALSHGLEPPRILNNNLSLAVMQRPVWPGCVSSNNAETLRWLRDNGVAHMSWSSTARGYFLPEPLRLRLAGDDGPEECFGSADNAERRARAERLGAERGVSALNIAAAWVLAQPFPSFALVGTRSPGEIASTLAAAAVRLTPDEVAWLNLED